MSTMLLLRWLKKSFNEDMKKCKTTTTNKETQNSKHSNTEPNKRSQNN